MDDCVGSEVSQVQSQLSSVLATAQERFGEKSVQAVQAQWTTFVSAECTLEANPYLGGTIHPLIDDECVRNLTVARIEELQGAIASLPH